MTVIFMGTPLLGRGGEVREGRGGAGRSGVAERVELLEAPGVVDHRGQVTSGAPAPLAGDETGVGDELGDVTGTSTGELHRQGAAGGPFEGGDEFEHRRADAGAEVA